jgi:hypothetical protein
VITSCKTAAALLLIFMITEILTGNIYARLAEISNRFQGDGAFPFAILPDRGN